VTVETQEVVNEIEILKNKFGVKDFQIEDLNPTVSKARISDLNYVHQKYTERLEAKAEEDLSKDLPFGDKIQELLKEYHEKKTVEAILAKDADNIELLLTLKEQVDSGNERAKTWIKAALSRLKSKEGQALADKIIVTDSDHWWFADKDDKWWITRNKK
jgi:putative hydrolase of HD superfamily